MFDEFLFHVNQQRAFDQARRLAVRKPASPAAPPDPYTETLDLLRGPETIRLGTLSDDRPLDVSLAIAQLSGLVIGASNSGKTRFILSLLMQNLRWSLGRRPKGATGPDRVVIYDEICDPKTETVEELKKNVAADYLAYDEEMRERLARSVRVLEWSRDAVSPTAPFDNSAGAVSGAYLADLRTSIEVAASGQTYTDSIRHLLFMLYRVLIAKRYPLNCRFCRRFLKDAAFRGHVLDGVSDRDLVAFFSHLEDTASNQTIEAALRRIERPMAYPEIALSIGMPPSAIDRLLLKTEPLLTLGNFGPGTSLPPSRARERASNRVIDYLLEAPRKAGQGRRRLVIEEAAAFLSSAEELAEPLANAARTHRSFRSGIMYAAQDFEKAIPGPLAESLTLNSAWWAIFRSKREGAWIAPYAADCEEGTKGRTAFAEKIAALPQRHFYFYGKTGRALPACALDVPSPETRSGLSKDELLEIFQKEIAVHSLIPAAIAQAAIEQWEADVVDRPVAPPPSARPKRRVPRGIEDFLSDFDGEEPDA